jgi:rubrerythrin
MQRKLYREMWKARFTRMLTLEKQSVDDYKKMLEHCRVHHKDHSVVPLIERLIREETKHVELAQELMEILDRQSA